VDTQRIQLTYYIGLKYPAWNFEEPVIKEACRLAGGCTVSRSIGYWIESASVPQFRYAGPVDEELCFKLEVSVPIHDAKRVHECMRSCIAQEAKHRGIDTNWVHVTRLYVETLHFSVDEVRP
jgi:hypothetical protein